MPYRIGVNGELFSNSVIGTFAESLSPYFKKIILIGFTIRSGNEEISYRVNAKNIEFNNLGPQGKFWDYLKKVKNIRRNIHKISNDKNNILLLRVPSPLAYLVWKHSGMPTKTILLLIGNPQFTKAYFNKNFIHSIFKKIRSDIHDFRLKTICRNSSSMILVNSKSLQKTWGKILNSSSSIINTSSISMKDICDLNNTFEEINSPYKLLFIGRICFDKGIRELLGALKILNSDYKSFFSLDLVGPLGDLNGLDINSLISDYKVGKYVNYHGSVQFGNELFQHYQKSHIYILPSYHEGMPKTIWESIANGTPVIASKIDGIKDNFIHKENILFIKPKSVESIVSAVIELTSSNSLFKKLIYNGISKSKKFTRENQAKQLVDKINKFYGI